jgi:cell division septation protein DedD
MAGQGVRHFIILGLTVGLAGGLLAACTPGTSNDGAVRADGQPVVDATVNAPTSIKLIDRDVEAPDVFQTEGQALWDGRPSLGGVWVASPDAKDPERVIMRNPANGKFVIGALFRRERDNPGPKLQISSDAADALGLLAGEPARISVTALRREEAPVPATDAKAPILDSAETVGATPLPDVTATDTQAIDAAEAKGTTPPASPSTPPPPSPNGKTPPATTPPATTPPATTPPATTPPATTPPATTATTAPATPPATAVAAPAKAAGSGPLIQIGIFSVEANAQRAVDALTKIGITATIRTGQAQGKSYWAVTAHGGAATLAKIKAAGFADAYLIKK